MKGAALYEHLLGLKTPWSVKKVDLSLADQRVVVEVVLKKGQVWAEPTNATKRVHINGWTEREWRHLDTCQFETIIKARVGLHPLQTPVHSPNGSWRSVTLRFTIDLCWQCSPPACG